MKNIYKIIFCFFILSSFILFNSCDPFEDILIKLSLDTDFSTFGSFPDIRLLNEICLTEFDDYNDNQDKIEEIRYITSAYTTLSATTGLRGDNLKLRIVQSDSTTLLAEFTVSNFVAANYIDNPLEIKFTQQDVDNINRYLSNHKVNNCFYAVLEISNVQPSNQQYELISKVELLTELKVKP
jgi:hypothetical protein